MTTTLLRGGRVHTPSGTAGAMLVTDDTVTWTGDEDAALPAETTVELDGALVTPAFVDAHVHTTQTGLALDGLDLADARSLAEVLTRVGEYARRHPGQLVLAGGWDDTTWPERRAPTAADLDAAAGGAPVFLSRVDGHSAVVSSAVLAAVPEARELPGYDPNGHLRIDAHHAVRGSEHAAISPAQRTSAQRTTRRHAASLGIGCLHEMAGPILSGTDDMAALLDLAAAEPGPDVVGYWGELGDVDTVTRLGLAGAGGDLFADGSLGSHTAALTAPYEDQPTTSGYLRFDGDQIAEHVVACTRAGVQAGFHAIGDLALATVLHGMQKAAEQVGQAALVAARHRIEHVEMPPAPEAFARMGLACSVQPAFDATWGGTSAMYAERLGVDRALGLNPFAAMYAAGVGLALGSDSPVTPIAPWAGVRAAVHHRTPGSGLPPAVAFDAATRGGWWAARQEGHGAGTLVPGAPATYAIWQVAEFAPDGLPDLTPGTPDPVCVRTVVRGQTVYDTLQ